MSVPLSLPVPENEKDRTLELQAKAYSIGGSWYIATEASTDAAIAYRNACARAAKMEKGKVVGVDKVGEAQLVLVCACLFHADKRVIQKVEQIVLRTEKNDRPIPVHESIVRQWPSAIQDDVFNWVKEHSDGLIERPTVEGLEKQIADLQEQLAELRADQTPPKGGPEPSTDTSGSAGTSATA